MLQCRAQEIDAAWATTPFEPWECRRKMFPSIVLTDPTKPGGDPDLALRPIPLASGSRDEAWLRDFLLAHPAVLPTASIDAAYVDPLPVCRELRTAAGRIDCLFITRFGGLVIVECKLWRNPQARREVVAQIFDYAKEIVAWDYGDLQREISIARDERGINPLFELVASRYPDTDEAAFVDAVTRNLARGRLMLLLAGDGIHEGTERIVEYVGRYPGLYLTFGLVEMAGYEMPDGRLLVQPRVLARTTNLERAVVRVEGLEPDRVDILAPGAAEESEDQAARRSFDPVVLEADRRWRVEFVKRLHLDDPAQAIGREGFGRIFLELPVPWAWMTAYSSRRNNTCGNTLVLKGDAGADIFQALRAGRQDIDAELSPASDMKTVRWRERGDFYWVEASRQFSNIWTVEQEPDQIQWLLTATNTFVNTFRPRILRLLKSNVI
jgi:hypothetical protein